MSFLHSFKSTRFQTRSGVALAALLLCACASKNPLIDEAPAAKQAAAPVAQSAAGKPQTGPGDLDAKTTSLSASQRVLWFFSPYRVTVQQGNFISQEMVEQLKTGMTREQVRFIAGTPLLADVFHGARWDYPFRLQKGSGETTTSRIAIFFKDDKVERIESGELPSEKDYLNRIAGPAREAK
ncbi:outer membrane protein assembly factor BamE [Massilia sp. W12]|uniref:outer membrane protein assembly factor BamE n=1 Tax=Massilia sp. W12 TaxID=3126507 RepID=UPI0030D55475